MADVGDAISGWAFFNTKDFYFPPWNDNAQVYIYKGGTLVATVFDESVLTVGDRGYTPWTYWTYWTYTFPSTGIYTVSARVANTSDAAYDSHIGLDALVYTPVNKPPTANAGGPYSVSEGGSVLLSGALSTDPNADPLTFGWDLDNDGIFETLGESVTFSAAGLDGPSSPIVSLQVCDPFSECDIASATVDILNVAPTANAGGPYSVDEGGSTVLNGAGSDPGPDALTYSWDLDNDGVFETLGQNPAFSAAALDGPSTVTVALKVCDDDGACGTATSTVDILNVAPTANTGNPYSVDEGGSTVLNGAGSDPGPDALTYSWDLDNDGTFETLGQNPTFSAAGLSGPSTVTVALKVCDDDGACGTATGTVDILNVAPTANAGGPYSVDEGGSTVLNGAGSDPGPDALTYSWDLDNDGTFETLGQNPTFSAAGLSGPSTVTVALKICDDDGACDTATSTVDILNVADTGIHHSHSNEAPVATAGFEPIKVEDDEGKFLIVATATDPDDNLDNIVAVIEMPAIDGLETVLKVKSRVKIKFDYEKGKVKIEGPDPEAILSQLQLYGGLLVDDGLVVKIELDGDSDEAEYKFQKDGTLKIKAHQVSLRVTATDADGESSTAAASPEFSTYDDDDDDDDD